MRFQPTSRDFSENGITCLRRWEGVKNKVYLDSAGLPTIGIGHLLTRNERTSGKLRIGGEWIRYRDGLTDCQVNKLLYQDMGFAVRAVQKYTKVNLNQNEFDALCSFTFNVGTGAFKGSTLLRLLNEGKYKEVPAQMRRWKYSGGRVVKGLINRRRNEIRLWNKPER